MPFTPFISLHDFFPPFSFPFPFWMTSHGTCGFVRLPGINSWIFSRGTAIPPWDNANQIVILARINSGTVPRGHQRPPRVSLNSMKNEECALLWLGALSVHLSVLNNRLFMHVRIVLPMLNFAKLFLTVQKAKQLFYHYMKVSMSLLNIIILNFFD